jgi:hypothetical protein
MGFLDDLGIDPIELRTAIDPAEKEEEDFLTAPAGSITSILEPETLSELRSIFNPASEGDVLGEKNVAPGPDQSDSPKATPSVAPTSPFADDTFVGIMAQEFTEGLDLTKRSGKKSITDGPLSNFGVHGVAGPLFTNPIEGGKAALGLAQAAFSPLTAAARKAGIAAQDSAKAAGFNDTTAAVLGAIADLAVGFITPGGALRKIGLLPTPASIGAGAGAAYGAAKVLAGKVRNNVQLREVQMANDLLVNNAKHNHNALQFLGSVEESTLTLDRMGKSGQILGKRLRAIRDISERETGTAVSELQDVVSPLSKLEKEHLVQLLDRGFVRDLQPTQRTLQAAAKIRNQLDSIGHRAEKAGMTIVNPLDPRHEVPFQVRGNFFPHQMSDKALSAQAAQPLARQRAINQLMSVENDKRVAQGKARLTKGQANHLYSRLIRHTRMRRGEMEFARIYNLPDFDRDPVSVLAKYYQESLLRVNQVEQLGNKASGGKSLVARIGERFGKDAGEFADTALQRALGTESYNPSIIDNLRGFQAMLKLGQAVIANASQTTLTAIEVGPLKTMQALGRAFTKEGRRDALQSGVLLQSVYEQLIRGSGVGTEVLGTKLARGVLKGTGFLAVEKANRMIAANAGILFAEDLFRKLATQRLHKRAGAWRSHLEKMGVNVDEALKIGELSREDLLKSAQSITNRTQFRIDSTELPLFWTSPLGRTLTQFKSFGFKSGQFAKNDILKPALAYVASDGAQGDIQPLLRALVLMPLAGGTVEKVREVLRGGSRSEQQSVIRQVAEAYAAVGTFGLAFDAIVGPSYSPESAISTLFGPTVSDLGQVAYGGGSLLVNGNPDPLLRLGARNIPVIGPTVARQLRKPSTAPGRRQTTRRKTTRR